jgi:diguanylate cyclase (GGDEF)-like protein
MRQTYERSCEGKSPVSHEEFHLLLVEDSQEYAAMLQMVLGAETSVVFHVVHAVCLRDAFALLDEIEFDIALLDLSLPDSLGLDTFLAVHNHSPFLPVVMITALDDSSIATRAVREGAQDYLVKGDLDVNNLIRSLRYAIERKRSLVEFELKMLTDELTGLYNRRGFLHLAAQQLRLSRRTHKKLALIYLDMDNLKAINDSHGHQSGDQALIELGTMLKQTFRESDIVARIGGDEMVVLAINVEAGGVEAITKRLSRNIDRLSQDDGRKFSILVSWGMVNFDPENPITLDELLERADTEMYVQKRRKKDTS